MGAVWYAEARAALVSGTAAGPGLERRLPASGPPVPDCWLCYATPNSGRRRWEGGGRETIIMRQYNSERGLMPSYHLACTVVTAEGQRAGQQVVTRTIAALRLGGPPAVGGRKHLGTARPQASHVRAHSALSKDWPKYWISCRRRHSCRQHSVHTRTLSACGASAITICTKKRE